MKSFFQFSVNFNCVVSGVHIKISSVVWWYLASIVTVCRPSYVNPCMCGELARVYCYSARLEHEKVDYGEVG